MIRLMLSIAAFLAAAAPNADASSTSDIWRRRSAGLVAAWDWSGGRTTTPTGHAGTLVGDAVISAGTRYLSLDGNDHMSVPDAAEFSFTDGSGTDRPFSAGGWVYLNSNATSNKGIILKGTGSPIAVEWAIKCANGPPNDPSFILYHANVSQYIGRRTGTPLATGQWIHVFGTYSGNESPTGIKVYINGVRADTTDLNTGSYTGMSNTAALLRVGGIDTGEHINGRIGTTPIFNYALTDAEVARLYNQGAARMAAGGTP